MTQTPVLVQQITDGLVDPIEVAVDELARLCETLNLAYRDGHPLVTDRQYDELFVGALRHRAPDHPFLNSVEPEGDAFGQPTRRHVRPLLSTEKAYDAQAIDSFFRRVARCAADLGQDPATLRYRALAKLDGIAGVFDGSQLLSRGDGLTGSDLTVGLDRGLVMVDDQPGLGEIVVLQDYFESVLKPQFGLAHARNFVAGFFSADTVKPHHRAASDAGVLRFVPYTTLPRWTGTAEAFLADWQAIMNDIQSECPYLTDGIVLELDGHEDLREALGATSHHYRYQLAIKAQGETREVEVLSVRYQTGRTGRVTPVIELPPTELEGSVISNVTAHTAQTVSRLGIGSGAIISITRAGGVIPKLCQIIKPADRVEHVTECPSCGSALETDGEYAVCPNTIGCPAQAESRIIHWFKTLGNAHLFGPATATTLVDAGLTDLRDIYALSAADFEKLGFGPGQARNLRRELGRSLSESIPDWRWLGAAGIRHLGRGDSRRLLAAFTLDEVLDGLTAEQISGVEGFGAVTSPLIADALAEQGPILKELLALGFTLESTKDAAEAVASDSALSQQYIVFTGAMQAGSRDEMQAVARQLGAIVQSAVNSKTDILVAGERAGSKLAKAQSVGEKRGRPVRVLSESDWLSLVGS